jgi:hypothetical protein
MYSGATTNTLTLTNATVAEAGNYDVVVSGACSITLNSNTITVSVLPNVTPTVSITSSDVDNTFCSGTKVTFTAKGTNGGTNPSYQWKNKGIVIPNQTSPTYTSTTLVDKDEIGVDMTSNATCLTSKIVSSNNLLLTIDCNSNNSANIKNESIENIRIFPNPSSGKFTIQGIPAEYTSLELIDHSGRVIAEKTIKQMEFTEEYTDIAPGIYLLKFSGKGQTSITKSIEIQ